MRRGLLLLTAAVPLAGLTALVPAAGAAPLGGGTGSYGVVSDSDDVTVVTAPAGRSTYVARYEPGSRVTIQFPVSTGSRWPVRLVEVAPPDSLLTCGWRPDRVELVDLLTGEGRPFAPVPLRRDEVVQLRASGTLGCADGSTTSVQGLVSIDSVVVRYEVLGGWTREAPVELGYAFGWSEEPDRVLEGLVRVQPPADR